LKFRTAKDEFFAKIAGIAITFTRDDKGALNGMVLHQHGNYTAPKTSFSTRSLMLNSISNVMPPSKLWLWFCIRTVKIRARR
jgi:hypothetical protein